MKQRRDGVAAYLVQGGGGVEGVGADFGSGEFGEVAAAVEGFAQVAGDGADVGSPAAIDFEFDVGPLVLHQVECVDIDRAGFEFHFVSAAGEVVGAAAFDFHGAVGRRGLEDLADEILKGRVELGGRGRFCSKDGRFLRFGVVGRGGGAELDRREVLLGLVHEAFAELGGFADEQEEDAGGEGVEGSGVADLGSPGKAAFDGRDGARGTDAGGFVEVDHALERGGRVGHTSLRICRERHG